MLKDYILESQSCIGQLVNSETQIQKVIELCITTLKSGNKIIFCGNGGSAADAQHLAAEFMGRFLIDRKPLPSIALSVDTSALTAIGNDYGFGKVFARQLSGIGKTGDLLIAISTSGNSENIIEALKVARDLGIYSVSLTGANGGKAKPLADISICTASEKTNIIQEAHIVVGHYICKKVEEALFS